MMTSLRAAEAETQSAYVGAIRALAPALDARDPYTAGHSERVSALSVAIGQHMALRGRSDRSPAARRAAARHRQDRRPRRRAAEAGRADGGGVRSDQAAPGLGARILRTCRSSRRTSRSSSCITSGPTAAATRTACAATRFPCSRASSTSPTPSTP